MSNEFVARKGLQSLRSSSFEETIRVSGSIYSPAEAFLTASWASHSISSSYALTASYVNITGNNGSATTASIPNTLALRDTNGGTGFKHILFDTAGTPQPAQTGMISWNTFEGTLDVNTDVSNVTIQVGQETLVRGRNNTGGTLLNGSVVYFSGSLGNKVMIWPAMATPEYTSQLNGLVGVVTEDILKNNDGYVTLFGKVNNINTTMYQEGDPLYLSDTQIGQLTTIEPTGSSYPIRIGRVLRVHQNSGSIIIQPRQIFHTYDQYQTLIRLTDGKYTGSLNITGSVFVTGGLHVPSVTFDPSEIQWSASLGELTWDTDFNTLQLGLLNGVRLQVGQEVHVYGDNFSGKDIHNGDTIHIEGSSTNRIKFVPAISKQQTAPRTTRFHPILGIATQEIPNNTSGYVTLIGTVNDVNTSNYSEGAILYLSHITSGSFTSSLPPVGWDIVEVGTVIRSHLTGSIFCKVIRETRFDDITGIDDSTPYAAGQMWKANGDGTYSRTQAFTGSLLGTSSYAGRSISASYSATSSVSLTSLTASYVTLAQTASYVTLAQTASYVANAQTASYIATASYTRQSLSASYVKNSETASYALVAQTLIGSILTASYAYTSSVAMTAISASYALTASLANDAISASYALSASYATTSSFAITASYVRGADVDIFSVSKDGTSVGGLLLDTHFLAATTALISELATTANGAAASGALIAGDIGHPGILQLTTGTTTTGRTALNSAANCIRFGSGTYTFETTIMLPTNSDAANRYTLYVGFGDATGAGDQVDGAYFQYTDASSNNWQIKTATNSVRTTTTTSVGVVGNTWTKLKVVVVDVGIAYFYINDTLAGSINNNVPQGDGRETGLIFKIEKSAGTTARRVSIDYCKVTYE